MTTNTQSTLIPFVIELNGVNFKELTKDLQKPLDGVFAAAMQSTLRELCRSIPGCTFGMTEYGRIVLCVSGVEAVEKEEYASLATKLFHQEFRIAAENWMIDEGIRMPMYTLQRDPHFCPSDEVLRLEKVYLSLFDKGEFEASICTGDTPKWDIVGLGKVDTRFYLFYRRQNHALGFYESFYGNGTIPGCPAGCIRGACCYQVESASVVKDPLPELPLPDWCTPEELEAARKENVELLEKYPPEVKPNEKPGMEWVIDLNPPDFRDDKDYIMRWV